MKRYRFRLEQVLHVRQAQEEMALQELATANRALWQALTGLHAEQARYQELCSQPDAEDVPGFRRQHAERTLRAEVVAQAQRSVTQAEATAVRCQGQWSMARRRVQALERLDTRRRAEYDIEVSRAEVAAVDDLVTSRFVASVPERQREGEEVLV